MAVEDKYVNALVEAGKLVRPAFNGNGVETFTATAIVSVAAADDDGSVYRLFKGVTSDYIPTSITITNSAITGGTDYELGLYDTNSGAAVDIDVLLGTTSMASGRVEGAGVTGLGAVALADTQKRLWELAGQTMGVGGTKLPTFDIALTANTVGSAAGTIVVKATFVQG